MGKKVRNKARSGHKEKRASSASPKIVPHENKDPNANIVDDGAPLKESKVCVHLQKAVDPVKASSKIESAECIRCEDCRESAIDRRAGKGKGKHSKKKGACGSKSESKATWVCLQCGHFACGGVGLPTTPQSHAVRHSRQSRHPLVIQFENPHLRWCFSCNTLISDDKLEDTGEQKDVLSDVVKLLKKQSSKESSVDVEDVWFGSGSVVSELKAENKECNVIDGKDLYAVKGLVNLGNTCFFNSVMQNLLAMDRLREYILKYDGPAGPLTSSLKKVILETSLEAGQRNVINPRSLFGCVCSKAPQFRGYQQQDSHELLRCLLDVLSAEDSCAQKSDHSSSGNPVSLPVSSTFVDAIFGGRLSSTVFCVKCGHSSVVYEPFLDLSLPVPTKKPPIKKAQQVSRARKGKLPPKICGKTCSNLNKGGRSVPVVGGSNHAIINKTSCCGNDVFIDYPSSTDHMESSNGVDSNGSVLQNSNDSTEPDNTSTNVKQGDVQDADGLVWLDYLEPVLQSDRQECEGMTWLDYLETVSLLDPNLATKNKDISVGQDSGSKDGSCSIEQDTMKASGEIGMHYGNLNIDRKSTVDDLGDEPLAQVQDNQVLLLPYKEDCVTAVEGSNSDAEISLSAVASVEDSLGFDGLGDLFNEPEVDVPTSLAANDPQSSNHLGNGFLAGNISESDPDEVDNTDSPVSVESCLSHFTKPELLSGEHAWHCENCSKLLLEGRRRMRKLKAASMIHKNLFNVEFSSSEVQQIRNPPPPRFLASCTNGSSDLDENLKNDDTKQTNRRCLISTAETRESSEQENTCLDDPVAFACFGPSDEESLAGSMIGSQCVFDDHISLNRIPGLSEEHELEENEEEGDSQSFKVMREATKRILIDKTPPIMTIHLKRFCQDARGRLSKLNGYIGFNEYLNVGPYLDYRCRYPEKEKEKEKEIEGGHMYRLVGVVEHAGSMRGGHYVAYVRRGGSCSRSQKEEDQHWGGWYYASDAHVREVSIDEVLRCEAYLLFYQRLRP